MSRLEKLIEELCPDGVEYIPLENVTEFRRGSFPQPYTDASWYGGTNSKPFVQVADMLNDVFALVDKTKQTISEIAQPKSVFVDKGTVLVSLQGTIGRVAITQYECYVDRTIAIFTKFTRKDIDMKYFAYVLKQKFDLEKKHARGSTLKTITKEEFSKFQIPLPPIQVQRDIVRILDNFTELTAELAAELTAELTARKKQYEYYRNSLLSFSGDDVNWLALGEIGSVCMCKRIMKAETSADGEVPFYKIGTFGKEANAYISQETYEKYKSMYKFPKKGDILISAAGTIGRTVVYDGTPAYFQDSNIVWIDNDESKVLNKFLIYCYAMKPWNVSAGGTIARLYNDNILKAKIPVPSLEEQKKIVSIIEKLDMLCNNMSESLPIEIEARQKQYEYYRDKLLAFKELGA